MTRNRVRPGQPFSFSASLYNELLTKTQEIQRERPQVIPERYIHVRAFNAGNDPLLPFLQYKIGPTDSLAVPQPDFAVQSRLFTRKLVQVLGVSAEPGDAFGVVQEPIPPGIVGEIVVSGSAWMLIEFDEETENAKWADVSAGFIGKAQNEPGPIRIEFKTAVELIADLYYCFVTLTPDFPDGSIEVGLASGCGPAAQPVPTEVLNFGKATRSVNDTTVQITHRNELIGPNQITPVCGCGFATFKYTCTSETPGWVLETACSGEDCENPPTPNWTPQCGSNDVFVQVPCGTANTLNFINTPVQTIFEGNVTVKDESGDGCIAKVFIPDEFAVEGPEEDSEGCGANECHSVNSLRFSQPFQVTVINPSEQNPIPGPRAVIGIGLDTDSEPDESILPKKITLTVNKCGQLIDVDADAIKLVTQKYCKFGPASQVSEHNTSPSEPFDISIEVDNEAECDDSVTVKNTVFCSGGSTFSQETSTINFQRGLVASAGTGEVLVNLDLSITGGNVQNQCCQAEQAIYKWNEPTTNEWNLLTACPGGCVSTPPPDPGSVSGEMIPRPCVAVTGSIGTVNQFNNIIFRGNLQTSTENNGCSVVVDGKTIFRVRGLYATSTIPCPDPTCQDASGLWFSNDYHVAKVGDDVFVSPGFNTEGTNVQSVVPQSLTLKTDCAGRLLSGTAQVHQIQTTELCSGSRHFSVHDAEPQFASFPVTVEVDSQAACGCNCGDYEDPPQYQTIEVLSGTPFIEDGNLLFPQKKVCVLVCANDPEPLQLELQACPENGNGPSEEEGPVEPEGIGFRKRDSILSLLTKIEVLEKRIKELEARL